MIVCSAHVRMQGGLLTARLITAAAHHYWWCAVCSDVCGAHVARATRGRHDTCLNMNRYENERILLWSKALFEKLTARRIAAITC